jgi:hypothetical protein
MTTRSRGGEARKEERLGVIQGGEKVEGVLLPRYLDARYGIVPGHLRHTRHQTPDTTRQVQTRPGAGPACATKFSCMYTANTLYSYYS